MSDRKGLADRLEALKTARQWGGVTIGPEHRALLDEAAAALRQEPSVDEVARVIDPLVYELTDALNNAEGEPEQLRRDATAHRDARLAQALAKAQAIHALYRRGEP